MRAVVLVFTVLSVFLCSLLPSALADFTPIHVYTSLTGDPTEMQVTFTTLESPPNAQVKYWANGGTAIVIDVTAADIHLFVRPITSTKNFISSVTMTKLQPFTYYNYQIMGNAKNESTHSQVFKVRSLPPAGHGVSIGIYGDLGAAGFALMHPGEHSLPKVSQGGLFDLIVHNGDFGYNLGSLNGGIADRFMHNIQQVAAFTPYMATPGNHEFMGRSEAYYNHLFVGQTNAGKKAGSGNAQHWWSVDAGPVHIVGISTEVYCEDNGNMKAQYEWLEQDLAKAHNRADKPWIVVLGHRPVYYGHNNPFGTQLMRLGVKCTSPARTDCNFKEACKDGVNCAYAIEDLLTKYKVDMFNAGHMHSYMRHYPIGPKQFYEKQVKDRYINPQHPVYIISGAAGAYHGPEKQERMYVLQNVDEVTPPIVTTSETHSYSLLRAFNHTHINYHQISAVDGSQLDEFWIIKDPHHGPWKEAAHFEMREPVAHVCEQ